MSGLKGPCELSRSRSKYCFLNILGHLLCSCPLFRNIMILCPLGDLLFFHTLVAFCWDGWCPGLYDPWILFFLCQRQNRQEIQTEQRPVFTTSPISVPFVPSLPRQTFTSSEIWPRLHSLCSPIPPRWAVFLVSFVTIRPVYCSIQSQILHSQSSFYLECLSLLLFWKFSI